jgi:hypothetical protein
VRFGGDDRRGFGQAGSLGDIAHRATTGDRARMVAGAAWTGWLGGMIWAFLARP